MPGRQPCFICGSPTITYRIDVSFKDLSGRRLLSCPLCGIVDDGQADAGPLGFVVVRSRPSTCRWVGPRPAPHSAALFAIKPSCQIERVRFVWPVDSMDQLLERAELPWDPGPGVSTCALYLIEGWSLRFLHGSVRC